MVHTGEHLDPTTDVMITTLSLSWNALHNVKKNERNTLKTENEWVKKIMLYIYTDMDWLMC